MTLEKKIYYIERAIMVLRERGWTQGLAEDKRGRVCLMGALNIAYSGSAMTGCPQELALPVVHALPKTRPPRGIACYNDHFAKSVEDVIAVLQRSADALKQAANRQGQHDFYLVA